uniref:PIN-like protein n=1 Tax=Chenopodium quinoa TaxID=63459 RepID=A0A803M266_CHEQI
MAYHGCTLKSTSINGVKVYSLTGHQRSLATWLNPKKQRALRKDKGIYPPQVKVYELRELSLKFERHLVSEIVDFEVMSDDYSKIAFMCADRSICLHAKYGSHYKIKRKLPKVNRHLVRTLLEDEEEAAENDADKKKSSKKTKGLNSDILNDDRFAEYAKIAPPLLGGFYIWTYTFHLVKSSSIKFKALRAAKEEAARDSNDDLEADVKAHLLNGESEGYDAESHPVSPKKESEPLWRKIIEFLHLILEELMAPPSAGAIIGLIFGATTWLRGLVIGDGAPLQVIQDSLKLLGDGTIPSITLILGGNLIQGLRSSKVKPIVIIGTLFVKYLLLPVIGIGVVKAADTFGFLPPNPLYRFVLMLQFTLPPAMSID